MSLKELNEIKENLNKVLNQAKIEQFKTECEIHQSQIERYKDIISTLFELKPYTEQKRTTCSPQSFILTDIKMYDNLYLGFCIRGNDIIVISMRKNGTPRTFGYGLELNRMDKPFYTTSHWYDHFEPYTTELLEKWDNHKESLYKNAECLMVAEMNYQINKVQEKQKELDRLHDLYC